MLRYQIQDGKLWHVGDGKSTRARAWLECVTQEEAKELVCIEHVKNGDFGHDLIKITLLDHVCGPNLSLQPLWNVVIARLSVASILHHCSSQLHGDTLGSYWLETILQC